MLPHPFAPFRIRPGDPIAEAEALAARTLGAPLVVDPAEPGSPRLAPTALGRVAAGSASDQEAACRGADGRLSGTVGHERACPNSTVHRERVAAAGRSLLEAGYAGVLLDRPDLVLGLGLFGAGFCEPCQAAFQAGLRDEYGTQLDPFDFRRIAADELATAPGAVSFRKLHFGRDFWRFRLDSLPEAIAAYALPVRDAARTARRDFSVVGRFEQVGPAQFQAARLLDAAVFPLSPPGHHSGGAAGRLWRAAVGRRPVAAQLPGGAAPAQVARWAAALAGSGVAVGMEEGERAAVVEPLRRLLAEHAGRRDGRPFEDPVAECLAFYSPDADVWSSGLHRLELEEVGETLSRLGVQWEVATGGSRLRPGAVLVLPQAIGLHPVEATAITRFLESGGKVLVLGEARAAGPGGRMLPPFLPEAKVGRTKATRAGGGSILALPPLVPEPSGGAAAPASEPVGRALAALSGRGRPAVQVVSPTPLSVSAFRPSRRLDVHVSASGEGPVRGATLVIASEHAGSARRARFRGAGGLDEKIALVPSAGEVAAVLPEFQGYGVLSLVP
ncbi:MAG TPA: hypothetical protein VFM53_12715 [Anaeromyxobacteraceae bacterium]|nr:hypothetical protein [Anaeromyxobacteraceae bacterium]